MHKDDPRVLFYRDMLSLGASPIQIKRIHSLNVSLEKLKHMRDRYAIRCKQHRTIKSIITRQKALRIFGFSELPCMKDLTEAYSLLCQKWDSDSRNGRRDVLDAIHSAYTSLRDEIENNAIIAVDTEKKDLIADFSHDKFNAYYEKVSQRCAPTSSMSDSLGVDRPTPSSDDNLRHYRDAVLLPSENEKIIHEERRKYELDREQKRHTRLVQRSLAIADLNKLVIDGRLDCV